MYKSIKLLGIVCFLLSSISVSSYASMAWQPVQMKKSGAMSHDHRRGPKMFQLTENPDSRVSFWKPTLEVLGVERHQQHFVLNSTGMDNYHALVAEDETEHRVAAAIRYIYYNGKPSGESPTLITTAVKTPFEIVPAPLPREHWKYRANNEAVFLLRHEDKLISDVEVTLTTSNGSSERIKTDRNGAVRFTLKDDFAETKPGRRINPPAELIVSAEHQVDGVLYQTTLSAAYHVDPAHWKSFPLGLSVLGLGFVSGMVIIRRSNKQQDTDKKGGKA